MKTFEKQRLFQGPPRLGLMGRVDEAAADGVWSDYGGDTPEYDRDDQEYYAYSDSGGHDPAWGDGYDEPSPDCHDEGWDGPSPDCHDEGWDEPSPDYHDEGWDRPPD